MACPDPEGSAWRVLSLLDGLALQAVAHQVAIDRADVVSWSIGYAEAELGLPPGSLDATSPGSDSSRTGAGSARNPRNSA